MKDFMDLTIKVLESPRRGRMFECGKVAGSSVNGLGAFTCGCMESHSYMVKEPDLSNRMAKCGASCQEVPSSKALPMFRFLNNKDFDEYYCGCHGWD